MRSLAILVCVGGLALGCAHSHDTFYYKNGKVCAVLKSTVIGTGETEKFVTDSDCVTLLYDTKDTGFSDNATELGGKISEGLAKGAVEGLMPGP